MKKSFCILPLVVMLWIFCSDYNPFENSSNINIVIIENKSSVYRDSTANIFTTETLTVMATVRQEIDSFTLYSPGNRYWSRTSVATPISAGEYVFLFSFSDTGRKEILLNTYRKNGDVIPTEFFIDITSPLSQGALKVERGTIFSLSTPPVGDKDVTYNWKFYKENKQPLIFSDSFPSVNVQIDEVLSGDTGYLWVEDTSGNKSPETPFNYSVIDTTGPVILCLNQGLNGDTVVTGAGSFVLKIECNDGLGIGGALVNDTNFSDSTVNIKSTTYYKTFTNMDTLTSPFTTVIRSWDTDTNETTRTFYIRYDSNGPKEVITIKNPPVNPYTTNNTSYRIVATIFNPTDSFVTVTMRHIESGDTSILDTLAKQVENDVAYTAILQLGSNTLELSVLDTGNTIVAKDTVSLIYTTGIVTDTSAPYINRITVNGVEGTEHFISGDSAILLLEVFDENLDSVVINGTIKTAVSQFLYRDSLPLIGGLQYFIIHVNDKSDNVANDTVLVMRNSAPIIFPEVAWPRTLVLGKPWSRNFSVYDADGDTVTVVHVPAPGSSLPDTGTITFTSLGPRLWNVYWNGSANSSNLVNRSFETYVAPVDGKEYTAYSWNFSIKDSGQAKSYVFDFFLPNGIDTTEKGAIDLSTTTEDVSVLCIVVADAKPFSEKDVITVVREDQALTFAADAVDTNWFYLTFMAEEIKGDKESILIMVTDSLQDVTLVDTLEVIYSYDFPEHIDSLGWMLKSDSGIELEGNKAVEWGGMNIHLGENDYTNEYYNMETMPIYLPDTIQDLPALHFSPEEHSNLLNTSDYWLKGPFTLFFVARLEPDAPKDSAQILISASAERFIGFGVIDGKVGIYGQLNVGGYDRDTAITCDLKVSRNQWHILCYSSKHGIGDGSSSFDLQMWVDGYACPNNSIMLPNVSGAGMKYMILGGGSKHLALKNWDGDMAELIKYSQFLNDNERLEVERYLASRFKIKLEY